VNFKEYAGVTHDFFGMGAVLPIAREAQEFAGERLKRAAFPRHAAGIHRGALKPAGYLRPCCIGY